MNSFREYNTTIGTKYNRNDRIQERESGNKRTDEQITHMLDESINGPNLTKQEGDVAFGEVSRAEWNAPPCKKIAGRRLIIPIKDVRFVLQTHPEQCTTKEECIKAVQAIERVHMAEYKLPEINYHFLIGGDGNVYEGRGWSAPISRMPSHVNSRVLGKLTIAYIGDFANSHLPKFMMDVANSFLRHYVNEGKVSPDVVNMRNGAIQISRQL